MKTHSIYICQQCGYHSSTYLGKCPQCDSWNSFVETVEKGEGAGALRAMSVQAKIINLANIQKTDFKRIKTGLEEFDRCLGGGIVAGSLILVSGDPGIGKSTLLTQLALNVRSSEFIVRRQDKKSTNDEPITHNQHEVLYIAGEESAQQIKIRVDRISPKGDLAVLNETDVDNITETIKATKPSLVIVDSIQTLETQDLQSIAGSIGQVRECAHRLQKLAKALHVPIFLVGHVTKEGNLAGPKTLEHVVDVVLSLEGDAAGSFRILRAAKNRFGSIDEVGIFEMEESGMIEVNNPSKLFLEQKVEAPGSVVVATTSGFRPILVEVQALVAKSFLPMPKRAGSGIDNNRLQLLIATLVKRLGLPLFDKDIFVNITGGLKVYEPAADLGICMAIISSLRDKIVKPKSVFIGEVGLLGELRMVRQLDKRASEAKKLGYTNVISPQSAKNLAQAVKLVLDS